MQAHVVTAPGDGIAPAVLLSLPASGTTAAAAAAAARQPPAQYLFNVPEGFARLVLEHKLRPGTRSLRRNWVMSVCLRCLLAVAAIGACLPRPAATAPPCLLAPPSPVGTGLRAAFAPDPAALSGFGGLVMRLRGEGHSQLHVVGPPGAVGGCSIRCLNCCVDSLRHVHRAAAGPLGATRLPCCATTKAKALPPCHS